MPSITFYRHGLTASIPNMGNPNPPKRGRVVGWSAAAARRNTNFLRSIDERDLGENAIGYALTLTVRQCPPAPADWTRAVNAWVRRQSRGGMKRLHWVMEFQRRGVPHLHAAIWYTLQLPGEDGTTAATRVIGRQIAMVDDWLELAEPFGAGRKGQHWRVIDGPVGWFQYMAKHCSRSKVHYQRQRDAVPAAWASSPRVWGSRGDWPIVEPTTATVSGRTFHRLRRLVRSARLAEARAGLPLNRRQVSLLRRMLKCPEQKLSSVRPVSEWMDEARQRRLLLAAS